jgi:hypothetical protein
MVQLTQFSKGHHSRSDTLDPFSRVFEALNEFVMDSPVSFLSRFSACGLAILQSEDSPVMTVVPSRVASFLLVSQQCVIRHLSRLKWMPITASPDVPDVKSLSPCGQLLCDELPSKLLEKVEFWVQSISDIEPPQADLVPQEEEQNERQEELELPLQPPEPFSLHESTDTHTGSPTVEQEFALLRMKFMRFEKHVKNLKQKIADRDKVLKRQGKLLAQYTRVVKAQPVPSEQTETQPTPSTDNISSTGSKLQDKILDELRKLASSPPSGRRYSEEMLEFGYTLNAISAQAYRHLRAVLPFPSARIVSERFKSDKETIAMVLREEADLTPLKNYLRDFRSREQMPEGLVKSTLAFDATSVTATGIGSSLKSGSSFAYLLLPMDHRYPDLLIRSILRTDGKMKPDIIASKDKLCDALRECGFIPHFIATDGDNGMDKAHTDAFERYANMRGPLKSIVEWLTRDGPLEGWPTSDLFHLMKNARARLALWVLAFNAVSRLISGDSVTKNLRAKAPTNVFQARKPLDLLKDDLAIHAFTLENLIALFDVGDLDGAYFLLPFVCLNLATRNPLLHPETRLSLLSTAFDIFFSYVTNYPDTGLQSGISERTITGGERKTFWTRIMCKRACNLCVGLYWSITEWLHDPTYPLALDRISSHPCECHFGMTRSTLKGDTRAERFLNAEINAVLIRRSITHLGLRPYIRRFKTEAGCTLLPGSSQEKLVNVPSWSRELCGLITCMGRNEGYARGWFGALLHHLKNLAQSLAEAGWVEKAGKSSLLSGGSITLRLFKLSKKDGPDPETTELLHQLADE